MTFFELVQQADKGWGDRDEIVPVNEEEANG